MIKENKYMYLYISSCIFLFFFHVFLGSYLFLNLTFTIISIIGVLFLNYGKTSFTNMFIFFLSIYSGYAALLMKAFFGQELQSNLLEPFESGVMLGLSFFMILLCGILSKSISNNRSSKIGKLVENENFKYNSILIFLILGVVFRLLHLNYNGGLEAEGGFGGFGVFKFVFLLGLTIAFKVYSELRLKKYAIIIIISLISASILAIASNTKKDIFDFILLSGLCIFYFNIKISKKTIVSSMAFVLFVILFISPAIHLTRFEFKDLTLSERIYAVYNIISDNEFNYTKLYAAEAVFMEGFQYSYGAGSSYIYPRAENLDRFFLILPIDQVVRNHTISSMGVEPFLIEIAEASLPSILIKKTPYTGPDLIAWRYGIRDSNSVARPVIGFTASSFAAGGIIAVIFFPIFFLLPFLIIMDYVFGNFNNRLWGVFGFIVTVSFVEKEIDQILPFLFRNLPIIILFVYLSIFILSKKIIFGLAKS